MQKRIKNVLPPSPLEPNNQFFVDPVGFDTAFASTLLSILTTNKIFDDPSRCWSAIRILTDLLVDNKSMKQQCASIQTFMSRQTLTLSEMVWNALVTTKRIQSYGFFRKC